MSEAPLFDPDAPVTDERRKEKVTLDRGYVWVWELDAADYLFISERTLRPDGSAGNPVDRVLWRILVSCYKGDQPGAERVFGMQHLPRLQKLRGVELARLLAAIERVNGLDAEEVPRLMDFTAAAAATSSRS